MKCKIASELRVVLLSITLVMCGCSEREVIDSNDRNSWQEQVTLEVPTSYSYLSSIAFSPDSKLLATAIRGPGEVRLWDVATGRERLRLKGFKAAVFCVAFSPDAKTLATAGGSDDSTETRKELVLWEVATGQELRRLKGLTASVCCVAFSPDGNTLAYGENDTAKLWDLTTNEHRTLNGHETYVLSVAFSPDGKTLATGSHDYSARLWDVETGTEKHTLHLGSSVSEVAFSPDGKMLAAVGQRHSRLWDVATGELVGDSLALAGPKLTSLYSSLADPKLTSFHSLSFSPDGRMLAVGGASGSKKTGPLTKIRLPFLKVLGVATGNEITYLVGHKEHVVSVAFSPNGKTLATGSYDGTAKLWSVPAVKDINIPNWQIRDVLRQDVNVLSRASVNANRRERLVLSVAFSPDGSKLAAGHYNSYMTLWDVTTGKVERVLRRSGGSGTSGVAFSADGKALYARRSKDYRVWAWDVASGERLHDAHPPDYSFTSQALSPDGRTEAVAAGRLVGGNLDSTELGTIFVQDSATGKEVVTLRRNLGAAMCAAFSPNGELLATGSGNSILIWQVPRDMKDP